MFHNVCQPLWTAQQAEAWSQVLSIIIEKLALQSAHYQETCLLMPGLSCQADALDQHRLVAYAFQGRVLRPNWMPVDFDPCALPFKSDSFDRVIAPFTLDFLGSQESQQQCLAEMCRVLTNSGHIDTIFWRNRIGWDRFKQSYYHYALPKHRCAVRRSVLKSLLEPLGYVYNEIQMTQLQDLMPTRTQRAMVRSACFISIHKQTLSYATPWRHITPCHEGVR